MVSVSLIDVLGIAEAQKLWPVDFQGLINKLAETPDDRAQMLVIADWLKEHEEPLLESAFRYVARRPEITLSNDSRYGSDWWSLGGVTWSVSSQKVVEGDYRKTPAAPFAELARQLESARRDLE